MSNSGDIVVHKWQAPSVDDSRDNPSTHANNTSNEVDLRDRAAIEQRYEQGFQKGLNEGRAELEKQVSTFKSLVSTLSRPFDELDGQVERELVKLSMVIAQHLVRRELKADPNQIMGVVREALKILPVASRDVRLHLHPEDAALIRELFSEPHDGFAWSIVEDPMITRGGCQVTTQTSRIDARIESRIGKIFAEILGGERSQDE